jgi:hypothetical protein
MIRATLLALVALTGSAFAAEPVDGAWTFTTSQYRANEFDGVRTYTIVRGTLVVEPSTDDEHKCEMTTEQAWYEQEDDSKPVAVETETSEQTCLLTQSKEGKVTIVGEIVSSSQPGYRADDFSLTLESSSRMTGEMHSRWSDNKPVAKAIFSRGNGEIS